MNTKLDDDARTEPDDERLYPLERAYGPRRDRPPWRRIEPDLSGGWIEVHRALDCDRSNITAEDVTSL